MSPTQAVRREPAFIGAADPCREVELEIARFGGSTLFPGQYRRKVYGDFVQFGSRIVIVKFDDEVVLLDSAPDPSVPAQDMDDDFRKIQSVLEQRASPLRSKGRSLPRVPRRAVYSDIRGPGLAFVLPGGPKLRQVQHAVSVISAARLDMLEILDFIDRDNSDAADRVEREIQRAARCLQLIPKLGAAEVI